MNAKEELYRYVAEQYGVTEEYLWDNDPSAVLRHADNRKWFGVVMRVRRNRLGLEGDGYIDIITLKCDEVLNMPLREYDGILESYHMNKKHWITALLDGTVSAETLHKLIDMSFALTSTKKKKQTNGDIKEDV